MSVTAFQRRRRELAKQQAKEEPKETDYNDMKVDDLKVLAKEKGYKGYSDMKKDELIALLEGDGNGERKDTEKSQDKTSNK